MIVPARAQSDPPLGGSANGDQTRGDQAVQTAVESTRPAAVITSVTGTPSARTLRGRSRRNQRESLTGSIESQERLPCELEPQRAPDRVLDDLCAGGLERPRRVMDVGAVDTPAGVERVEAVALGEEVLQRAGPRRRGRTGGAVPGGEAGRWGSSAHAAVRDLAHGVRRNT